MLAKNWQEHGDVEAAHRLVTSHLRLVAKIAMGYRGYGLPLNEIISEGNVGLMQAVKRFDPDRGFRLATYAMWWIRAAIQEYILHSWSLVKMGTTAAQKKLFFNLRKLKGQMQAIDEGDLRARDGQGDRRAPGRHRDRRGRDEPPPGGRRPFAERAAARRQRDRVAGLAGRRDARARRARVADADEYDHRMSLLHRAMTVLNERERAHPERAAAQGRADHARGAERAVRHLARAGAPDRGARVRKTAARDQGAGGRAGGHRPPAGTPPGAPAGTLTRCGPHAARPAPCAAPPLRDCA